MKVAVFSIVFLLAGFSGLTAAGDERHYSVFLTGVFFCLYAVDMSIERDD